MAILSIPIVGIGVVVVLYVVMWGLGTAGRAARGEPVELTYAGCPDARAVVAERVADMGLEASFTDRPGGFGMRARLTGDPDVDAGLPATLAQPAPS